MKQWYKKKRQLQNASILIYVLTYTNLGTICAMNESTYNVTMITNISLIFTTITAIYTDHWLPWQHLNTVSMTTETVATVTSVTLPGTALFSLICTTLLRFTQPWVISRKDFLCFVEFGDELDDSLALFCCYYVINKVLKLNSGK